METGLTKNQVISELSRSPHGKLAEYIPIGKQAAQQHAEFFAHLIAWDRLKGQVRDAKVALPVVSLTVPGYPEELIENSFAALSLLGPREMLKALRFALEIRAQLALGPSKTPKGSRDSRGVMTQFTTILGISLLDREKNWPKWERTMLQHREVVKELFSLLHVRPQDQRTKACLYRCDKINGVRVRLPYPERGLFETVARLKDMSPAEAAGTIMQKRIPFLVALGALGEKAKNTDLVLALIGSMTATELVTNTKILERLGIKTNPALRGAFQEALGKAGKSKANVLKTTTAAENIDDEELKETLRGLQEKQIQTLGGVEGNWLVLGDKSGSMSAAIELAKHIAATLAKMVKGKVWLVFFDTSPQTIDVTGAALDVINKATRFISAGGNTCIGCGLLRMLDEKIDVDGIAIVSDGGENTAPAFADIYSRYSEKFGKQVPVYFYQCNGDSPYLIANMQTAGLDMQIFDMRNSTPADYYSLPNLVQTMRTNRYSLVDEIMDTRLLKLADVYKTRRTKSAARS